MLLSGAQLATATKGTAFRSLQLSRITGNNITSLFLTQEHSTASTSQDPTLCEAHFLASAGTGTQGTLDFLCFSNKHNMTIMPMRGLD